MSPTKPDDARVNTLFANLYGSDARGVTAGQRRHEVQQIYYIEEACRELIETVQDLEKLNDPDDDELETALRAFKSQFHFLRTLFEDKEFVRSFGFLDRR